MLLFSLRSRVHGFPVRHSHGLEVSLRLLVSVSFAAYTVKLVCEALIYVWGLVGWQCWDTVRTCVRARVLE